MNKIHHANIVVGKGDSRDFVMNILKNDLDFDIHKNPDFLLFESESFGIEEARNLGEWAARKPLIGEVKVYFLITKSIGFEAQNALLKVLEEPTLGTYFFISLENVGNILPTFLSRVRVLEFISEEILENKKAAKFLNGNINERLAIVRTLSAKEDKNLMRELIKDLEEVSFKTPEADRKKVLTAKIFATARGSSPRMLLEWLACVV
jgi:DNA polymerase III gamma/tau subunit